MRSGSSTRCSISASSRWASLLALSLVWSSPAQSAEPVLPHAQRVASYTLDATLDGSQHRVTAHGSIELFNFTRTPLTEVYLHLYMNAFKNDESLFLRSPFGAGRSGQHGSKWGYVDVKRLVTRVGAVDLWPAR